MFQRLCQTAAVLALAMSILFPAAAQERYITVASTTSTENSGLFAHILPAFEAKTGIKVRIIAVGTGQAIKLAQNGDADVLLVHHRKSEEAFVAKGFGLERHDVMYNDFVVIGPKLDPAAIKDTADAAAAFAKIAGAKSVFISRGDKSGTHKKEREIWQATGTLPEKHDRWYLETGLGMGAALNMAAAKNAYTMSDRGTWLSFNNKAELDILVAGDKRLFNPYGVILVNPERFPHVKQKDGQAFIDWLLSPQGQAAISGYKRNGEQLFYANAVIN